MKERTSACLAARSQSDNPVQQFSNVEAAHAEDEQAGGDAPEPLQIAGVLLAGYPDVHAPQPGDDVHGQHDSAQHGELAEHVGRLLLPLVHADVDLRKVVAVRAREDPAGQRLARIDCVSTSCTAGGT